MIGGTLGLNFVSTRTATNREMGILRRFKATPIPSWKWMVSEITASVVVGWLCNSRSREHRGYGRQDGRSDAGL
jgi:hypothetical protein